MEQVKKKPGRPKIEDKSVEVIHQEAKVVAEMKNTAYSIVKVGSSWQLVRIKFNPSTGDVGVVEFSKAGDTVLEAQERFKIVLGKELLK